MALDQITSKILESANQEKAKILQQAEDEKAKIIKSVEEQAALRRKQALDKAHEDADARKRNALIKSQMESKKRILAVKREILDLAFEKAIEALPSLPLEQYRNLLHKVLLQAVVSGTEEVRLNSTESVRLDEKFWKNFSDELQKSKRKSNIKTVIDDSITDGVVVRGEREQVDCRVSTIVGLGRREMETDVARILFGDLGNTDKK